jgi:hypothetical protein
VLPAATPTVVESYAKEAAAKGAELPPNLHFHPFGIDLRDHNMSMSNRYTRPQPELSPRLASHCISELFSSHWREAGVACAVYVRCRYTGFQHSGVSEMLSLGSIERRLGTRPDLLKMDIEGTEWSVQELLPRTGAEQILLELHGRPGSWLEPTADTVLAVHSHSALPCMCALFSHHTVACVHCVTVCGIGWN